MRQKQMMREINKTWTKEERRAEAKKKNTNWLNQTTRDKMRRDRMRQKQVIRVTVNKTWTKEERRDQQEIRMEEEK